MERRNFIKYSGAAGIGLSLGLNKSNASAYIPGETSVREEKRSIPVSGDYDVIVCGAGPAGVSAAVEAGRTGARVLLIEAHGCLGGVWTSGLLTWILDQANKSGFLREIENKLKANNGVSDEIKTQRSLSFDPEVMKITLEEICADAAIDILFHTRVVASVRNEHARLTHVISESKSGREAWKGEIFLDTTGDGDLAALSGCGYDLGREDDGAMQPFSLLALVTGVHFGEIRDFTRWEGDTGSESKKRLLARIRQGGFLPSYRKPSLHPIREELFKLMANHEYGYSPVNAAEVTKATLHARSEVHSIVKALRSTGGSWENLRIIATGEQIGTREGRRIHGLYTVTAEDLVSGARFDDAVCRVTFGVDVHSVALKDDDGETPYNQGIRSKPYDIPLRSLIARDTGGLMMAGRCISGDFIAHASYRVTGNAVPMGQAAGRVAAVAAREHVLPQDVKDRSWSDLAMKTISSD